MKNYGITLIRMNYATSGRKIFFFPDSQKKILELAIKRAKSLSDCFKVLGISESGTGRQDLKKELIGFYKIIETNIGLQWVFLFDCSLTSSDSSLHTISLGKFQRTLLHIYQSPTRVG